MKKILTLVVMSISLTACNTMTNTADKISNRQSSFSKADNTVYPTVDGSKDGEPDKFTKQAF